MSKAEDYLKQNVKVILQPLVKDIMAERPKDAVNIFSYNYLYIILDSIHA
jgi:hypothetical protein